MQNPFYNPMNGGGSILDMLTQLKANPMQVLSRRFNIPENINDPAALIQHLLSTGQVSQQQVDAAFLQAKRLGVRR